LQRAQEAFMAVNVEFVGLAEEFRKAVEPHLQRLMSGQSFAMDFSFPISKVDQSRREVTGVATDESVDSHGEILDYAASKAAFASWEKNIREMHAPVAVGRAVSVVANDAAKSISITARISRGAQDTWEKVLDGTLRAFSVGGTRLRSEIRSDGVRRTSEYKLGEVSLVDVPANASCKFAIAKSLNGRATATDVVALDTEADYLDLADALEKVAHQLAAKCRPLPAEVTKALNFAGSSVTCDQLAPDNFSLRGPKIAEDLMTCAKALRGASALEDLEKARGAAAFVLGTLVSRRDLAKSREGSSASSRGASVEGLREEIAKCLSQLRGIQGADDAVEKLETSAMALHTVAQVAGGMSKTLFTAQELAEMRDKLATQLNDWHAKRLPQNVPEYRRLSDTCFLVTQKLKNSK
jgi:hypothetical protein